MRLRAIVLMKIAEKKQSGMTEKFEKLMKKLKEKKTRHLQINSPDREPPAVIF